MIKRVTLNKDHIALIRLMKFDEDEVNNRLFIDKEDPYMLSGRLEDIAIHLGLYDKKIDGTEYDPEGAAFPDDVEEYMLSVHHYITDNLYLIESLVHQMAFSGGITEGTYKCIDTELIWEKEA
jgi:hypothetical protein